MSCPRRTRHLPGPLLLITLACLFLASTVLRAHDPGLSALDVHVNERVTMSLSIATADVAALAPGRGDMREALSAIARDAIHLSIDGEAVQPGARDVTIDDGGAQVRWSFAIPPARGRVRHLAIASDVPKRMPRGHRQLLVVTMGESVVAHRLLDAESRAATIDLEAAPYSMFGAAWHFIELGVDHILSGYDHLVFLAGLLLAVRTVRELLIALTAFTAAHSVSLALVVIGGVHAPASIVEPLIAASIAWVGLENLHHSRRGFAQRTQPQQHGARWVVVFGFGLIHGFGLAGALLDLGFGSSATEIAIALVSFNGGVEAGQLAAAAAMLPLLWVIRSRPLWRARLVPVCSMMIVGAGGYWLVERVISLYT